MADTLKITVQFIEDTKNGIQNLVNKVQETLKDQKVNIGVSEKSQNDLKSIGQTLTSINEQVKNLGNMEVKGIDTAQYKALLDILEKIVGKLSEISTAMSKASWGKLGEDLNIAITEFKKLTKVAEDFGAAMSKSFIDSLTSQINTLLPSLTKLAKTLEEVKEASRKGDGKGGLTVESKSIAKAEEEIARINNLLQKVNEEKDKMSAANIDTSKLTEYENKLRGIKSELESIVKHNGIHPTQGLTSTEYLRSQEALYGQVKQQIAGEIQEGKRKIKQQDEEAKAVERLKTKYAELELIIAKMRAVGMPVNQLQAFERSLGTIQSAINASAASPSIQSYASMEVRDAKQALKEQELAHRENVRAKKEQERAAAQLTAEEQRLAQVMKRTGEQGSLQQYILQDLKSMAAQYLSVWGATSFIENMAQITGELELQQKSLEVIIGSASTAAELFGEIRDLSQQSPYTFQDLLKSTRQLAAFGIETKDLYGTMKALSDIGAGLSVDVQRLILAYGHVRSYGYLSGIQNRQFETAGVDLVGALADRYNKLADAEERAGRAAERVTRKDVFKKISKKEVGFEDVNAVIMDLASPGGRFYNMQERQFDTLGGKLRNLRNNYNIMMDEMGKSSHSWLMGGVNVLNELTANWEKYSKVILALVTTLGVFKLATLAANSALGIQSDIAAKNAMAMVRNQKATQAAISAMTGSWTGGVRGAWAAQGKFNPTGVDQRQFYRVLSKGYEEGNLTRSQLMMMGTSNRLPTQYREMALSIAKVDRAQIKAIASAKGWDRAMLRLRYSTAMAASAIRAFGESIKAALVSMLPMLAISAAISGIVSLFAYFNSMSEKTKETLDALRDAAKNDSKEIQSIIAGYAQNGVRQVGTPTAVNGYEVTKNQLVFNDEEIMRLNLPNEIEELKRKLQALSPMYDGDLVDIGKMNSQLDQFKVIMEKLESYRHAEDVIKATMSDYEDAAGWGFFSKYGSHEAFTTNLEDFANSLRSNLKDIDKLTEEEIMNIDKSMNNMLSDIVDVGDAESKAEALKMVLEGTLYMTPAERQKVWESWSQPMKDIYDDVARAGNDFGTPLAERVSDLMVNMKEMSDVMKKDINTYFKDDLDGAIKYATTVLDRFFSGADFSDRTKAGLRGMFFRLLFGEDQQAKREYDRRLFEGEVFKAAQDDERITFRSTRKDIEEVVKEKIADVKRMWKRAGYDLVNITDDVIDDIRKSLTKKLDTKWQQKLLGLDGDAFWTGFGNIFQKDILDSKTEADFWREVRKKFKELQGKLSDEKLYLRKRFDIQIDANVMFNADELAKWMKSINKDNRFYRQGSTFKISQKYTKGLNVAKEDLEREQELMNTLWQMWQMATGAKKRDVDLHDSKNKKTGGTGPKRDFEAERLKAIAEFYKKAYDWYNKYDKQLGSKDGALERVRSEMQSTLDLFNKEWKTNLSLDSIDEYRGKLRELLAEARNLYKVNPTKQRADLLKTLTDAMNTANFEELEKSQTDWASDMKKYLDDLTQQMEIFNSVFEETGNLTLAGKTSGISNASYATTLAGMIRSKIDAELRGIGSIDYDKILGMSEEEIKDEVGRIVVDPNIYKSNDEYQAALDANHHKITGIVEAIKQWIKAQQDLNKSSITDLAKMIGSGLSYEEQIERIDTKLTRQKEYYKELFDQGIIGWNEYDRGVGIATAKAEEEKWKLSAEYANLMSRSIVMASDELENGVNRALRVTNQLMKNNAITASQYADEITKLHKMQREMKLNSFMFGAGNVWNGFAKGGVSGAVSWLDDQIANRIAELVQKGLYTVDEKGQYNGNDDLLNGLLGKRGAWESFLTGLNEAAFALQVVTSVLDGLQTAAKSLSEMFDALGEEGQANFFSDVADSIGVVSSIFSPMQNLVQNAMNGNIGGIISSGIAAPVQMITGPITAMAQLHDKQQERRIQELRKDVQQIDNTLNTIKALRERMLGYDSGNLRRRMRDMYAINNGQGRWSGYMQRNANYSAAGQAMYDYYNRASAGNGYMQELELLKKQREDYMKMYEAEEDKKKSSSEALEEYKTQIAELDEQIMFFKEDLAKELWSIDFQGWAGQLGDALMTAFENGTSAAEAFEGAVKDIMRNVVKDMMVQSIIAPAFEQLRERLFGENGVFDINDPVGSMANVQRVIAEFFGPNGEGTKTMTAAKEFYDGSNDALQQILGYGLDANDTSKNLQTTISSSASEETMGMVAGYLAALRQDTAAMRILQSMFVNESWPGFMELYTRNNQSLSAIDTNTQAIMHMMRDGEGAMYLAITGIQRRMDNFANGIDKVTVR